MDSDDDVVYGPTPGTRGIVGFEKISPQILRHTSADSSSNGASWTPRAENGGSVRSLQSVGRVHVSRRRRALGTGCTTALGRGIDFGDVGSEQIGVVGHFQHNDLLLSSSAGDNDNVKVRSHTLASEDSAEEDVMKEDDDDEASQFSARCIDLFPSRNTSSTQNHTLAMGLLQDRPVHWGVSTQPNGWRIQTQRQVHGQSNVRGKVKGKGKREGGIQGTTSAFALGGLKRERKSDRSSLLSSQQTTSSVPLSTVSFRPSFMPRPSTPPKEILSEVPPAEEITSDVEGDEDGSNSSAWTVPSLRSTTMSSVTGVAATNVRPTARVKKRQQVGDKRQSGGIVADALQCACAEEDSSVARLISGIFPLREKTCKIPDLADPRSILTWSVDLVISQISPMAPNCLWVEGNVETVSMLCGKNSGSSGTMGSGKDCGTAASLIVGETVNAMFVKDTAQSVEFIVAARVRTYDPFVTWLEKHKKKVLLCVRKCERSPPPPPPNATIVANR